MAGTNHSAATGETAPGPAFILVEPQMGENIGAAARAMWNFGLDRMRLVNPRDGWPNSRAVAMASGAGAGNQRTVASPVHHMEAVRRWTGPWSDRRAARLDVWPP